MTGLNPSDMEDICAGRMGDVDYLFVADMGNNNYNRPSIDIIRFEEPDLSQAGV